MSDPVFRPSLADTIADFDRRLAALERGPRASYTSVAQPNGTTLARLGDLGGGFYGIRFGVNPDGSAANTWLDSRPDGLRLPQIAHPWERTGDYYAVTADTPTWSTAWTAHIGVVAAQCVQTTIVAVCAPSTSGQLRIRSNYGTIVGPVTLNTGGVATQTVVTMHLDLAAASPGHGAGYAWDFMVEATRTGGAGDVRVYIPQELRSGYWPQANAVGGLVIV